MTQAFGSPLAGHGPEGRSFMPKPLVWIVRLVLLLLTPLFFFCSGVARAMIWLDDWAANQLAAERELAPRES